ncbi:MAG: Ig-like domain-containing protein [Candidatus Peregrinibacteria bacterium]
MNDPKNTSTNIFLRRPFVSALVIVLAIAIVGLGITGTLRFPGSQQLSDFAQRQKVSVGSTLHFSFPALMDHASAQEFLQTPDGLSGTWAWDNETLTFTPAAKLKPGQSYAFHLKGQAKKADGALLGRDLDFTFVVAGPAKVAAHFPATSTDVPANATVAIVFDRPIVPLTQIQGDAAAARMGKWPVTISPETLGRWRWLSTVAAEFVPTSPLIPSTRYTVHVPKGITTVAGDQTEEDFSWTFETIRPLVLSTTPLEGFVLAGPTTEISLTFNQEMDPATAKPMIQLFRSPSPTNIPAPDTSASSSQGSSPQVAGSQVEDLHSSVTFGTKEVKGNTVPDHTTLIVVPASPLQFVSNYTVKVLPGVRGAAGELESSSGFTLNFQTVGVMEATSASIQGATFFVEFTNPVASGSINKQISISPSVEGWNDLEWSVEPWTEEKRVTAYPTLKPSTTYTVTVGTGIADTFGQHLQKPQTFTVETPAIQPNMYLESKGTFGVFEKDKPPVYRMHTVNASNVNLTLSKLSLKDFLIIRSRENGTTGYQPTNADVLKEWSVKPKLKKNEIGVTSVDLNEAAGASLGSGIYHFRAIAPDVMNYDNKPYEENQYFVLTQIGLTIKYSGNRLLVWALDLKTGAPVSDAAIGVHALNGNTFITGTTDREGFFESDIELSKFVTGYNGYDPEFWVTAEKDGDFSLVGSSWKNGIEPYAFNMNTDFWSPNDFRQRTHSVLYTDRPLYRTGDTVNFKGIVRLRDNTGKLSLPTEDETITITVNDTEGTQVYSKTLPITPMGSFSDSFPIDANATLGDYYMNGILIEGMNVSGTFQVLAYRKPEYKVSVTPEKEEIFDGDTVRATIQGSYYFGAPMSAAKVTWRARQSYYTFNKVTTGWYAFGLQDQWCWWNCVGYGPALDIVAQGEGTLDALGNLQISVPASFKNESSSQILTIEADITDPNNQVVSNRADIIVHKADVYVGIKSQDYVVSPGQNATMNVLTVTPDGKPLPNISVTLSLASRKWNTVKKKGVDGEYYYENTTEDTFVRSVSATTDDQGKANVGVLVDRGGEFVVTASAKDSTGREAKASTSIYAWSDTAYNWPHQNNDRIDVIADKPEYAIGDTAVLLVKSPYQGKNVKALVTVEREQIMTKQVITIEAAAQAIRIPITADLVPNAFVSVVIIKPRDGETFDTNGLDTGMPAFKMGYVMLGVETKTKRLALSIVTDKEQYVPGEKVQATLHATDYAGKPVRAELSLGVVDMSLLALTGFRLPDPVKDFYGERGLGIYTAEMLQYLIERYKPGSKGGGGDDAEAKARGNFKDTAYWNPTIITDEKGEASISFTLPDNLTTWHFLTIGGTKANLFGAAEKTVISTKHVIVRPVRPRFAVRGDRVELGAIVHNFLPNTETFTVTLSGSGFSPISSLTQTVTIPTSGMQKLLFPVTISSVDKVSLRFLATNGSARDEITESFPVEIYGSPQSVATTGMTDTVALEKVLVPSEKDAKDGTLTVSIAPTLAVTLPTGLNYLLKFPYGCAEQTISQVLPRVALGRLQGFKAFSVIDDKALEDQIVGGMQRLSTFQRGDGGFGFWSESPESSPALTAYILFGLQELKVSGYAIDDTMMARARSYLEEQLRSKNPDEVIDRANRAMILWSLSETGPVDVSLLKNLDQERIKLPVFAKAFLAMAYQNAKADAKAMDLLKDILNTAKVEGRGTHFEETDEPRYGYLMNTNDRTTALVLRALLHIDSENVIIPNVVRYLLAIRSEGHWDTTQSTAFSLLSLTQYLEKTNELNASYTAGIQVNGKSMLDVTIGKKNVMSKEDLVLSFDQLVKGQENEVKVAKNGTGKLYYDLLMSYFYTADTLPPAEEGISIRRSMEPVKGSKDEPTVGGTYRVTLTITVPEDRQFVAVESPLPAGMEPVDLSLATAQQTLLTDSATSGNIWWSEEYWRNGLWRFSHHEYRDDAFFLFADELPTGVYQYTYLVRATTPGTFHERPAHAWMMYNPEIFGQTEGKLMTIRGE